MVSMKVMWTMWTESLILSMTWYIVYFFIKVYSDEVEQSGKVDFMLCLVKYPKPTPTSKIS